MSLRVRCLVALACLFGTLVSFDMPMRAFRQDMHERTIFALALSAGWSWQDASVIAAADSALDENESTVASLEVTAGQILPHPAPKNFTFHCFSRSDDASQSAANTRVRDVTDTLQKLDDKVSQAVKNATTSRTAAARTRVLLALGVLLHCQQDSWSHSGYGGKKLGHTIADLRGRSPDRTAERPEKTKNAIDEALNILSKTRHDLEGTHGPPVDRIALNNALADPRTLTYDGLLALGSSAIPDPCVSNSARHWLYVALVSQGRLAVVPPHAILTFLPEQLGYCLPLFTDVFGLRRGALAQMVHEPTPRYPSFDVGGDAVIRPDGSYLTTLDVGTYDVAVAEASATSRPMAAACQYDVAVNVRNNGPGASRSQRLVAAIVRPNEEAGAGTTLGLAGLGAAEERSFSISMSDSGNCQPGRAFVVEVRSDDLGLAEGGDRTASNNRWAGWVRPVNPEVGAGRR